MSLMENIVYFYMFLLLLLTQNTKFASTLCSITNSTECSSIVPYEQVVSDVTTIIDRNYSTKADAEAKDMIKMLEEFPDGNHSTTLTPVFESTTTEFSKRVWSSMEATFPVTETLSSRIALPTCSMKCSERCSTTEKIRQDNSSGLSQCNSTIYKRFKDKYAEMLKRVVFIKSYIAVPLLCPIGILGNSFVAYVLFVKRNANSSVIYMICILVADIIALISDIFSMVENIFLTTDSNLMVRIGSNIQFWNRNVINMLFRRFILDISCLFSYERMVAVTRPLHLHKSLLARHSRVFILASMVLSIGWGTIFPLTNDLKETRNKLNNRTTYIIVPTEIYLNNKSICDVLFILSRFFSGPVQVTFFTAVNILIIIGLQKKRRLRALMKNENGTERISSLEAKLCKIFLLLSLTNMATFLPIQIALMLPMFVENIGYSTNSLFIRLLAAIGHFIRILNSFTDFIVFISLSKEIRNDMKKRLPCFKRTNLFTITTSNKEPSGQQIVSFSNEIYTTQNKNDIYV